MRAGELLALQWSDINWRAPVREASGGKWFGISGEPGGNRTHNPQIKSHPARENVRNPNDSVREVCRRRQPTAPIRRRPFEMPRGVVTIKLGVPNCGRSRGIRRPLFAIWHPFPELRGL